MLAIETLPVRLCNVHSWRWDGEQVRTSRLMDARGPFSRPKQQGYLSRLLRRSWSEEAQRTCRTVVPMESAPNRCEVGVAGLCRPGVVRYSVLGPYFAMVRSRGHDVGLALTASCYTASKLSTNG